LRGDSQNAEDDGAQMERIYDTLNRIQSLWKDLELTKPNTSEYDAILNQIRVLSDEYRALIDVPKKPTESK
jgi:hypothetical protein